MDDEAYLDPIRAAITALAYLIWDKEEDLPPHIEEAIEDVMALIE